MAAIDQSVLKQMEKDGIQMGIFHQDRQKFTFCGGCYQVFSLQNLPSLLECSHFICANCYANYNICAHCNKKKNVKKVDYKVLVQAMLEPNKSIEPNKAEIYSFTLKLNDSKCIPLPPMPGNITFSEMFFTIPQFPPYLKGMNKTCRLYINSASSIYEEICNMKIEDYNLYLQSKKKKSGSLVTGIKRSNLITFHNRYLGGYRQL